MEVITEPTMASQPEAFAGEEHFSQDKMYLFSLKIWLLWDPFPPPLGKTTKDTINRT